MGRLTDRDLDSYVHSPRAFSSRFGEVFHRERILAAIDFADAIPRRSFRGLREAFRRFPGRL